MVVWDKKMESKYYNPDLLVDFQQQGWLNAHDAA